MLTWLLSLFMPSLPRIDEAVYGIKDTDIDHLADTLASTFGIHFFTYQNPILGSWCSTVPISTKNDVVNDENTGANATRPTYVIIQNIKGPQISGAGNYLLMVTALTHEISNIREKLGRSGLKFKELKRKH